MLVIQDVALSPSIALFAVSGFSSGGSAKGSKSLTAAILTGADLAFEAVPGLLLDPCDGVPSWRPRLNAIAIATTRTSRTPITMAIRSQPRPSLPVWTSFFCSSSSVKGQKPDVPVSSGPPGAGGPPGPPGRRGAPVCPVERAVDAAVCAAAAWAAAGTRRSVVAKSGRSGGSSKGGGGATSSTGGRSGDSAVASSRGSR